MVKRRKKRFPSKPSDKATKRGGAHLYTRLYTRFMYISVNHLRLWSTDHLRFYTDYPVHVWTLSCIDPSFDLKDEKLKKVCIQTFCISSGLGLKYASSAEPHHSSGVRKAFEKSPEKKGQSLKCPRHGFKIIDICVHSVMNNRATEFLFRLHFFLSRSSEGYNRLFYSNYEVISFCRQKTKRVVLDSVACSIILRFSLGRNHIRIEK